MAFVAVEEEDDSSIAKKAINETFEGTGSSVKEERHDYSDNADPIREHDCIWQIRTGQGKKD